MSHTKVNSIINAQYSEDTDCNVTLHDLVSEKNTREKIQKFYKSFHDLGMKGDVKQLVLQNINLFVSPGLRGNKNGKKLNSMVFDILVQNLGPEFTVEAEKKLDTFSERVDIVVTHTSGKKIAIMNQVDLWGGGQQTNRMDKYLSLLHQDEKTHFLCVVCRHKHFSKPSRATDVLYNAFKEGRICYPNSIIPIIKKFVR